MCAWLPQIKRAKIDPVYNVNVSIIKLIMYLAKFMANIVKIGQGDYGRYAFQICQIM